MAGYKTYGITAYTCEVYGEIKTALLNRWGRNADGSLKNVKYVDDLIEPTTGKELGIQENDLWIVSIAKERNLLFITNDKASGMTRVVEAASYSHRTQFWKF